LALEGRQVFLDRVVEADLALVHQHHQAHGRDGFGHGADAEDFIRSHRDFLVDVGIAECFEIKDLVLVGDQHHAARKNVMLDERLELRGKSSIRRTRNGCFVGKSRRRQSGY